MTVSWPLVPCLASRPTWHSVPGHTLWKVSCCVMMTVSNFTSVTSFTLEKMNHPILSLALVIPAPRGKRQIAPHRSRKVSLEVTPSVKLQKQKKKHHIVSVSSAESCRSTTISLSRSFTCSPVGLSFSDWPRSNPSHVDVGVSNRSLDHERPFDHAPNTEGLPLRTSRRSSQHQYLLPHQNNPMDTCTPSAETVILSSAKSIPAQHPASVASGDVFPVRHRQLHPPTTMTLTDDNITDVFETGARRSPSRSCPRHSRTVPESAHAAHL